MYFKKIAIVVWVVSWSLAFLGYGFAADAIEEIKAGSIYGGLVDFVVSKSDVVKLQSQFAATPRPDGNFTIARVADSSQIRCLAAAKGQWIPAAAIAEHPNVPPGVISATDFDRVQACNNQWHQKVATAAKSTPFEMLDATIREADPSATTSLIDALQGITVDKMSLRQGPVTHDNAANQVSATLRSITSAQSELTKALANKGAAIDADKTIKEKQQNIQAYAALAQLASSVAFKDNPTAVYRINTTVRGLQTITDNIIGLGKEGAVGTGEKILAGLSITNAAFSMVSMFSPMKDQTTTMIEAGFSAVRQDISNLAEAMNKQFAAVEAGIVRLGDIMNTRFDDLEEQVDQIKKQLSDLTVAIKSENQVTDDALTAILSQPFWIAYAMCSGQDAQLALTRADFYAECIVQQGEFGSKFAQSSLLNGAAFFDKTKSPQDAILDLATLDPAYWTGFLQASLLKAAGDQSTSYPWLKTVSLSPHIWATTSDAYLASLKLGPELKQGSLTQSQTQGLAKNFTNGLIGAGKSAISVVSSIRSDGVKIGQKVYEGSIESLAKKVSAVIVPMLSSRDLGIVADQEYDEVKVLFYDNDDLKVELRRNGKQVVVTAGPQKGTPIAIRSYYRRVLPPVSLRGGHAQAVINGQSTQANNDWIKQPQGAPYGIQTFEPNPIVTDPASIQADTNNAGMTYLKAVPVAQFLPAGRSAISQAFGGVGSDPGVQNACADLSNARLYLMNLSMLYRSSVSLGKDWMDALAAMPGSDPSGDVSKACEEIIALVLQFPQPADAPKALVDEYVRQWVTEALKNRLTKFDAAYSKAPVDTDVAEVEARLVALKSVLPH